MSTTISPAETVAGTQEAPGEAPFPLINDTITDSQATEQTNADAVNNEQVEPQVNTSVGVEAVRRQINIESALPLETGLDIKSRRVNVVRKVGKFGIGRTRSHKKEVVLGTPDPESIEGVRIRKSNVLNRLEVGSKGSLSHKSSTPAVEAPRPMPSAPVRSAAMKASGPKPRQHSKVVEEVNPNVLPRGKAFNSAHRRKAIVRDARALGPTTNRYTSPSTAHLRYS